MKNPKTPPPLWDPWNQWEGLFHAMNKNPPKDLRSLWDWLFYMGPITFLVLSFLALIVLRIGGIFMRGLPEPYNFLPGLVLSPIVLALVGSWYLIPAWVAYRRGHHNRMAILALNILLGWTGLIWILALIWSLTYVHRDPTPN
jgi:hypothetical protein